MELTPEERAILGGAIGKLVGESHQNYCAVPEPLLIAQKNSRALLEVA